MRGLVSLVVVATLAGCAPEYEVIGFVGGDGELRFNLSFTNPDNVDLDLHVVTPAGEEIYYAVKTDPTGGELDVDCYCGDCPQGPNENIFWEYGGNAAPGEYDVWVEYYGSCSLDFDFPASDYELRMMESGAVLETFTGTLSDFGAQDHYSHTFAGVE